MNFWASLGVTTLRAVLLLLVAMPICLWLSKFLSSNFRSRSAWMLLLLPAIVPRMLTGYGYANFSISLIPYPLWNELWYAALLLISIVPVGTVLCFFAPPPPVSREAMHCLTLTDNDNSIFIRSRWWNSGSRYAAAIGITLLMAFQEFELASLMGVVSWTVWLFDAQAGGLLLSAALQYALPPLLAEFLVFGMVGYVAWKNARLIASPPGGKPSCSHRNCLFVWGYLAVSMMLFCVVPWCFVLHASMGGVVQLAQNFTMGRDLIVGCLFAFLATTLAYGIASYVVNRATRRSSGALWLWSFAFVVPGLLGSLVLGLSLLFVFQTSPLHTLYGTPVPWLLGLVLFLAPRALLVAVMLSVVRSPEANHLTRLLQRSNVVQHRVQARELRWRGTWALHFLAFGLLFFWAYGDLTMAAILAPPGIVSAPVRLYNLMHYGQSAVLSAMVVATFGLPMIVWCLVGLFRRPLQRVLVP